MTTRDRPARTRLRDPFADAGFRRLWAARTVSQWGDIASTVTLALLVYELTGSGLGVTAVVAAEILPILLLAPVAGALVDRLPRKRVMVAADLGRAALVGLLVLTQDSLVLVFVVAAGTSACTVFFNPAAGSVLPGLVRKEQLVAANSSIWTAAVLSQIALAPLAGLIVVTAGFGWGFAVNAGSFVVSALVLRGLRIPAAPAPVVRRTLLHDAREGARVVVADPLLRATDAAEALVLEGVPFRDAHERVAAAVRERRLEAPPGSRRRIAPGPDGAEPALRAARARWG
jgi:MFS family permease